MKKLYYRIFTSDVTLKINLVLAVVSLVAAAVCGIFQNTGENGTPPLIAQGILFVLLVILGRSYFDHEKNVMKCAIGGVFSMILAYELLRVMTYGFYAAAVVTLVVAGVLYLSHLLINSEHHSSPAAILFNQILMFVYLVQGIIFGVLVLVEDGTPALSYFLFRLATIFSLAVIVTIEAKLDAYRIARESK